MMYSWISRVVSASKATTSAAASRPSSDDPVAEDQAVAAAGELPGQVAVPGQQRGQHGEAVEGGVGGEHEHGRGERLRSGRTGRTRRRTAAAPSWAITVCWAASGGSPSAVGSSAMCTPDVRASTVIPPNIVTARMPMAASVRAALRDFGGRNDGTPLLIASTPVRAVQPEEKARSSRSRRATPVKLRSACSGRAADAATPGCPAAPRIAADDDQEHDARDEAVGRDGEGAPRLLDAPQVGGHERGDSCHGQRDLVRGEARGTRRRRCPSRRRR